MANLSGRLGPFRAVWANPALRLVQASWAGSYAGDAIIAVAFGVLAYEAAGSKGVAFLVGSQMLPAAFLAPLLSAATRNVHRERLVLVIDSVRTVVAVVAAVLAAVHVPHVALLVLAAISMTATVVSNPARRSLIPLLVSTPAELTAAGVVSSVAQATALTIGPVIAALLYLTTETWVVLASAAALLASVVVLEAFLPSTTGVAIQPQSERGLLGLSEGWAAVRANAQLKLAAAMFAAKNLARGALNVLVVVIPLELLGLAPSAVGWLSAMIGVGGVVGGIAATSLVGRTRLAGPMAFGLAIWALPLLALGLEPGFVLALAGLAVLGGGNSVTDVAGYTLIARSARDDLLTRVLGFHEGIRALAITAGSAITAVVIAFAGVRWSLAAAGVTLGIVAALAAARRSTELPSKVRPEDLRLLRANPLFGWLPPVALERIAFTVTEEALPAGAVLLRQGEEGDRAYLLVEGELVAEKDGAEIGRIRPGGVAGEIALLRSAPRMATVKTVTPVRMLAIDRDEFLAAATGGAAARDAADELVETRLAIAESPAGTTSS
jgi:predicted MFS family arabinose efflux permease